MALIVMAVSITVSPFEIEEVEAAMFITSAPRRLPAISKELCVRVEFSKNRLTCVDPMRMAWRLEALRFTST